MIAAPQQPTSPRVVSRNFGDPVESEYCRRGRCECDPWPLPGSD